MKPLQRILTTITLTAAVAGLLAAQTAAPVQHAHRGHRGAKLAAALGLNDQQKQQASTIFQEERTAAKPIAQSLRQQRQAVKDAIVAGKPASEVQQLAQTEAAPLADLAAIRATAFAKLYAILTPDQQQKLLTMRQGHKRTA